MHIIPDASVLLKLVLQRDAEPDYRQAFRLLEAYESETVDIALPSLWRYEAGNILGLKVPSLAQESMAVLLAYDFFEQPLDNEYCLAVLSFMEDVKGISFYDASYHVLAVRSHGLYVTADKEYVKKAHRKKHLMLLSEWSAV